jgi:hypothetical protein
MFPVLKTIIPIGWGSCLILYIPNSLEYIDSEGFASCLVSKPLKRGHCAAQHSAFGSQLNTPAQRNFDHSMSRSVLNHRLVHAELNPKIWDEDVLRPDVRTHLLDAAAAFINFVDIDGMPVRDIVLAGSNCGFGYETDSDIDVHVVVPYAEVGDYSLVSALFSAKKTLWTLNHKVEIHGLPVELYVEDAEQPAISSGVYSIRNNRWLHYPIHPTELPSQERIDRAVADWMSFADSALASDDPERIARVSAALKNFRAKSLDADGEFGLGNLVFKTLRSAGLLDKLRSAATAAQDRTLDL